MIDESRNSSPPAPRESFPTTRWSVVLNAAANSESLACAAFESLCRSYWYPLYAFARRQGRAHHEAEDCTQEFLARLIGTKGVARARPERGRFRSFLLAALRNFMTNEWRHAQAAKRGGGLTLISLDLAGAERRFADEPLHAGLTPEEAFDWNWARGQIEEVLDSLRAEYAKRGQAALFAELMPLVWGAVGTETLAVPAARAGMSAHAFTVALQRLRQRFAGRLRAHVAETVANPDEIDEELRYLIVAIGRQ